MLKKKTKFAKKFGKNKNIYRRKIFAEKKIVFAKKKLNICGQCITRERERIIL